MSSPREPFVALPQDPAAALEAYDPQLGHGPWDAHHVAHLLRRAVGGARPGQVEEMRRSTAHGVMERLFTPSDISLESIWGASGVALAATNERPRLASWWLMKLAQDEYALGNRLAVFWHDHFSTTWSKIADGQQMLTQHSAQLVLGAGPFRKLLHAMVEDPAMLRFLDGDSNRRGLPNENLARELFELFALGPGNYTEADIREAARALTGNTVRQGSFVFEKMFHDPEPKKVFGKTIQNGKQLVDLIIEQPACADFLVNKLWRYYVSPDPPKDVLQLLAERWREHDLDTGWLVRTLLSSRAFHATPSMFSLIKSPIDYVVGVIRAVSGRPDPREMDAACARMGQELFEPPGVQGWQGGSAWIHTASWLERTKFAFAVAAGRRGFMRDAPLGKLFPERHRLQAKALLDDVLRVMLPTGLGEERRTTLQNQLESSPNRVTTTLLQETAYSVMCLPEYHLS
ncbi:MAG: DUF1800 domain-containing protein [Planctomycetes bacterium]|nr:DUF1800 domain-containing protein [Planctomycetota bacterium]MCP4770765.1 DUF1800 domain-containing protein [Planctomycetota bacterium]